MPFITKSDKTPRRIALVDCNNFYVSCERVFTPAWRSRPVGILSNNDGCIIARSDELKEAGIKMGTPYFQYREQLETMQAIIRSSNYPLYGDMSARVMSTLGEFTPDMEIYSIDEAWLNLTGFNLETLDSYARLIVETTYRHTGIPVSIGIGSTKVLAKIANRICKKHKLAGQVFNLEDHNDIEAVLKSFDIEDVWGIGARWAMKLRSHGIRTAFDLRNAEPSDMRQRYNVVMQRIIMELRGIPCLLHEDIEPKKQIVSSRSFGQRITDKQSLMESVSLHVTRAAEKLRMQNSVCGILQVFIRTGRHNPNERFYGNAALVQLPIPTADTRKLIQAACSGIEKIYKVGPRYAKAGIMMMDITQADHIQGHLFASPDDERSKKLMKTIDQLNRRYGKHSIKFAAEGTCKNWAMKRNFITQPFTTSWQHIPNVKC